MKGPVAAVADQELVVLGVFLAHVANFAVCAVPVEADQFWLKRRLHALRVIAPFAVFALEHVGLVLVVRAGLDLALVFL